LGASLTTNLAPAMSGWGFSIRREVRRTAPFCIAYYWLAHCHTFGHPRRRFRLHPIQSFETGLKFVDWLNGAIGPFGLYFPILAIFKNHTKYRSSRRHVFTYPHMMARRE
jgi:hypothetical protein